MCYNECGVMALGAVPLLRLLNFAILTYAQNYGGVVVRLPSGYPLKYPNGGFPLTSTNVRWRGLPNVYPKYMPPAVSHPNAIVNKTKQDWEQAIWDYPLNPDICNTLEGLTRLQKQICNKYTDVSGAAAVGLHMAVKECKRQFSKHRWDCSALVARSANPHSAAIMDRGFRESAFGHSITAAGVTHSVARACAAGRLASCSCGEVRGKKAWKWSGCHDNTRFGSRFSRMFLDVRENAKDVISFTHLYNNEVGRKVVRRNRDVQCKCHGMSGSCEMRTCWKAAPDFRQVGETLVKKFMTAKPAAISVFGNVANTARQFRPARRSISSSSPLLFAEKSPTFCDVDRRLGVPGTLGRPCNKTSSGPDSCHALCCGRGYNIQRRKSIKKCNCRFKWCCDVTCQDCLYEEWITTCK